MEMLSSSLRLGVWGTVTQIGGSELFRQRLRAFGLIPGTRVCCRYRTPCGSVTALELRSGVIALRTGDMDHICVRCQDGK